jgi:outer membrane immunogenic protein
VHLGYNWQFAPSWVAGIETDFSFSDINGSGSSSNIATVFSDPGTAAVSERINWFGTVRGRLGFLATKDLLVYGTGGFAYGRVKQEANYTLLPGVIGTTTSISASGFGVQCTSNNICFHGASSETRSGWTAGLGVEKAFGSTVRFKLEYLYVNLGSNSFSMVAGNGAGLTPASWAVHFNDADFHVVRVGVSVPLWAVSSRQ